VLGVRIPPGLPLIRLNRERGVNVLEKSKDFITDVKAEMGRVTWPTRKETVATTWVVVAIIVIISLYLGACDVVLAKLIRFLLR
jgi:preprotein translocase subunit SecE